MSMTVACVLRSGGHYKPWWVERLRDRVSENLSAPHDFVCLTDTPVPGVFCIPLKHEWPGYWSKVELFRPDLLTGRVLYLDLDTEIVGPLDEIASYDGRFAMIDDWIHPGLGASAVMLWDTDTTPVHDIYEPFARSPEGAMSSHRGDQNWISASVQWDPLRQMYPGHIVSRWGECEQEVPEDARVICYHGRPRPDVIGWSLTGSLEDALKKAGAA